MKKLGTLALTLTLTGAMALPALAAEEPELVIAPADTGYGQTIVLNGETLDLTGIPGVSGEELLPLRLLAEADHGSAYWDEENNESWFTFGDNRITVKFADNSVWLDDQQVKSTAQVADGITFVEAGVLSMLEGYTVDRNPELDVNRIDITTPNNDPMVKAAYQIREDSGMAFGMRSDNAEVATLFQLPEDTFEQAICFTSMNTTPDIMVLAKLADAAEGELPSVLVESTYQQEMQNVQQQLQMQRMTLNSYLSQIHETRESFTAKLHAGAEKNTRARMALLQIAQQENLVPTDEEIDKMIAERAERTKKTVEEIREKTNIPALKRTEAIRRAADWVIERSTIEEK